MFYAYLSLSVIFLMIAGLLMILGDKGAILIGGFNTFSKNEKALYDKGKLVKGMRK